MTKDELYSRLESIRQNATLDSNLFQNTSSENIEKMKIEFDNFSRNIIRCLEDIKNDNFDFNNIKNVVKGILSPTLKEIIMLSSSDVVTPIKEYFRLEDEQKYINERINSISDVSANDKEAKLSLYRHYIDVSNKLNELKLSNNLLDTDQNVFKILEDIGNAKYIPKEYTEEEYTLINEELKDVDEDSKKEVKNNIDEYLQLKIYTPNFELINLPNEGKFIQDSSKEIIDFKKPSPKLSDNIKNWFKKNKISIISVAVISSLIVLISSISKSKEKEVEAPKEPQKTEEVITPEETPAFSEEPQIEEITPNTTHVPNIPEPEVIEPEVIEPIENVDIEPSTTYPEGSFVIEEGENNNEAIVINNPDGTTTYYMPDGSATTYDKDGNIVYPEPEAAASEEINERDDTYIVTPPSVVTNATPSEETITPTAPTIGDSELTPEEQDNYQKELEEWLNSLNTEPSNEIGRG